MADTVGNAGKDNASRAGTDAITAPETGMVGLRPPVARLIYSNGYSEMQYRILELNRERWQARNRLSRIPRWLRWVFNSINQGR